MRDFRDAKVMAHALRDALRSNTIEVTHSECLEFIAKAFGYDNWNVLSAKINAAQPSRAEDVALLAASRPQPATLYCSFCGKSQHDVRTLIAGPEVFICDECVGLCDDIVDHKDDQEILSLLKADEDSGHQTYPAASEHVRQMTTEDVASFVARCRKALERQRLAVYYIQRSLSAPDGDGQEQRALSASPRFAALKGKTAEALRASLAEAQRGLKRYEDALRIGVAVLDRRGQQSSL
jgi:hypothetical protein